jgi:hypothetical protein
MEFCNDGHFPVHIIKKYRYGEIFFTFKLKSFTIRELATIFLTIMLNIFTDW